MSRTVLLLLLVACRGPSRHEPSETPAPSPPAPVYNTCCAGRDCWEQTAPCDAAGNACGEVTCQPDLCEAAQDDTDAWRVVCIHSPFADGACMDRGCGRCAWRSPRSTDDCEARCRDVPDAHERARCIARCRQAGAVSRCETPGS